PTYALNVAAWDGSTWAVVGRDTRIGFGDVAAVVGEGASQTVYVGGSISYASGYPVNQIARWDGQTFSDVGGGMTSNAFYPTVSALAIFDDGTGPGLYAGGRFTAAGGIPANNIARWTGAAWVPLGAGVGVGGLDQV